MKVKQIIWAVMAALPLVLPFDVCAETEKVGDYTWQYFVRDDKAWIGSQQSEVAAIFPKPVGEVTVPSELGGYEVYRIDDYALYGCDQMTQLIMPDSVHQLGTSAFRGCSALGNVYLSENIEWISSNAFQSCAALTSVSIPPSVEMIDEYAFADCGNLSDVYWSEGNLKTLRNHVFRNCNALKNVVVPDGVGEIGHNMFLGCHSLTNAVIPNSVTNMGIYAFSYCNGLQSLTLPFVGSERGNSNTAESVLGHIFGLSASDGLTKVVQMYDGSSSITRYISTSLKSIRLTGETLLSSGAFRECNFLKEIVINEGVGKIEEGAFANCRGLNDIVIPQSVTNIETKILLGCNNIKSLTILFVGSQRGNHDVNTSLFGWLFAASQANGANCICVKQWFTSGQSRTSYIPASLQAVTVTDETIISVGAFQNCSNLTSVAIGNSVTNIAKGAFSGCGRLQNMSLPFAGRSRDANNWSETDCETSIGYIFGAENYPDGRRITIWGGPNSMSASYYVPNDLRTVNFIDVEELGADALYACGNIQEVSLNDGCTRVGYYTFRNCTSMRDFTIPNSVQHIKAGAFRGSGLESIFIPLSVITLEDAAFMDCLSLKLAYVPKRFKRNMGDETFANCDPDLQIIYYDENMKFFDETLTTEDSSSTNLVAVCTNDCRVSFKWKCSCEPIIKGNIYDYLSFEIDGVRQDYICGETDWQDKSYEVSGDGEHVFRWTYQKDEEGSAGEDCAWVKQVVVAPRMALSFDGGEATDGTPPAAMSFYADDESAVLPGCGTLSLAKHSFTGWSDGVNTYTTGMVVACSPIQKDGTPVSLTAVWEANTLSTPVIVAPETYEADSVIVTITADDGATIYYTLDGAVPSAGGMGCRTYQGPFEIEGSATIQAIAVKDNYYDSEVASFTVTRPTWTFGEYLNCPVRTFTTGGDAQWVRAKGMSDDGYALRSGAIGNSQTSRLETVVYGAGTIVFRCKVDGEVLKKIVFDGLAFCIDGVQQGDLMGENTWANQSFTVTGDGRHTLSWLYVKDDDGNGGGEDCAWLDNVVWTANDPLPPLDVAATDNDVRAILGGLSDVRLLEKIVGTTGYTAFRSWVDGKGLSHALVRDAPNAWLSYALDASGLMTKDAPLANEDVVIESIAPSAVAGAFDLVVSITDVEIGADARLAETLGMEGAAELHESAFSSDGFTVTLERTSDGKAKATVAPDGMPSSFFLRVKVK